MTKLLLFMPLAIAVSAGYAQPVININNRVTTTMPPIDAPISYADCGPATPGRINGAGHNVQGVYDWGGCYARVALYAAPAGASEETMVILPPACSFRSGGAAGYIDCASCNYCNRSLGTVVAPGTTIVVQLRAWDAGVPDVNTYEEAAARLAYLGKSGLMNYVVPQSGTLYLTGLQGFSINVNLLSPPTPVIVSPPESQTSRLGSNATFSVVATGASSYQWWFNTNAIAGATNSSLTISNIQESDLGLYWVVVGNGCGTATSPVAMLSVLPELEISMVPAITVVGVLGQTYQLQYQNDGGPTNTWTWLANVTLTNWSQVYIDASALGQPARIYRVMQGGQASADVVAPAPAIRHGVAGARRVSKP